MHQSVFDFILALKNIQTINKRKTQGYYTIILQYYNTKQFDLDFELFLMNALLFFQKGNKCTIMKQLLLFFFVY